MVWSTKYQRQLKRFANSQNVIHAELHRRRRNSFRYRQHHRHCSKTHRQSDGKPNPDSSRRQFYVELGKHQRHNLHCKRIVVWRQGNERQRQCFSRQHQVLHFELHGNWRHNPGHGNSYGHCRYAGAHRNIDGEPNPNPIRRQLDAHLVHHQCHRVYRQRRLERSRGHQWERERFAHGYNLVYIELQRSGRHGTSCRHRNSDGTPATANGHAHCQPNADSVRIGINTDLVQQQCHHLHC